MTDAPPLGALYPYMYSNPAEEQAAEEVLQKLAGVLRSEINCLRTTDFGLTLVNGCMTAQRDLEQELFRATGTRGRCPLRALQPAQSAAAGGPHDRAPGHADGSDGPHLARTLGPSRSTSLTSVDQGGPGAPLWLRLRDTYSIEATNPEVGRYAEFRTTARRWVATRAPACEFQREHQRHPPGTTVPATYPPPGSAGGICCNSTKGTLRMPSGTGSS
jgi:hypothetical protein